MTGRFLVTGGAGFIGSNLVEKLVGGGNKVVVLDDMSLGNIQNLESVRNDVSLVIATCGDALTIDQLMGLDGIFHLALPSSSPMYRQNPQLVGRTINEFITLLGLARRERCKIVYASSSSIYNGNPVPWREDMPIHVTDLYTECRRSCERLAELYHGWHGVESVGMRMFSVYGRHEKAKGKYANLVSQFLWAMRKGERPLIFGDGSQARDFIHVKDVVRAFLLAMGSDVKCDLINVGTGKSYTLNQLVDMLNKALGMSIEPGYVPNPIKGYVAHTLADTSKAERVLGFRSETALDDGIRELIG